MRLTPKVRKTLDITARLSIATLALLYVFSRIYSLPAAQVSLFVESVFERSDFLVVLISLFLLMTLNWGIETLKWKMLIKRSEDIDFGRAYQAILGGLASSVFTPNRVGEFIGRVFILKKTEPLKAILLTIVGSFSQILVTLVMGTIAYVFFAPQYLNSFMPDSTWLVKGFSFTLVTLSVFLIIVFFNISALQRISILIPAKFSEKVRSGIDAVAGCPKKLLIKVVLLSTVRYMVFSIQFYLAVRLMGLNFTIWQCMQVIPLIYLVLAAIPTGVLTELGVRGSVSVFLFGLLAGPQGLNAAETMEVVSASTLIWLVNIALPSLAGVLVIFRLKFFRR